MRIRQSFFLYSLIYIICLYFFYIKYIPLLKEFQMVLAPVLFLILLITIINIEWGTLAFILFFPLINNLPYFFKIFGHVPHSPTALSLFLFYFLGWIIHNTVWKQEYHLHRSIFKPMILFSLLVLTSGIITFARYSNFFPLISDYIYELITNTNGVTAGGALMSTVFFSFNYLSGLAFFFILINVLKSNKILFKILVVICLSTFFSMVFGYYQHFKNIKLGNNLISINHGLINATFKDALSLGAYIAITVSLFIGIFLTTKGIMRYFSLITTVMSVILILFTGSKISLVSLGIAIIIFLVFSFKLKTVSIKSLLCLFKEKKIIFISAFCIAAFVMMGASGLHKNIIKSVAQSKTISRLSESLKSKNLEAMLTGRASLWTLAVPMIKDYPLTGVGMGGYIIEVSNYSHETRIMVSPESAENYFFQVSTELGFVGLFISLWIFWEILKQIRRSYITFPKSDKNKFIFIGAAAGIISFLINIQVHSYIGSYEIKYTFWLLVAILFSLGGIHLEQQQKIIFTKKFKLFSAAIILLFSSIHLWNSTHSLALKARTEQFGLEQNFGLYQLEKTPDGKEFMWTKGYGGVNLTIEKPVISIPLHASHPDIEQHPVKVKIYLVKELFKQKKPLGEVILRDSGWKTFECSIPEEVGHKVIILIKSSRTWNPLKVSGIPDPRNLGTAMGKIQFKDIN